MITSCHHKQTEFNKSDWNTPDDFQYNHREFMIDDLLKNHLKKGMRYNDVIELLGNTEHNNHRDSIQCQFEIFTDYGNEIDPIESKYLVIIFDSDSVLVTTKINHFKKQ